MENNPINIVIPVAGMGRRMKSYGPKALINLSQSVPLLCRQLNILQDVYPKANIVIVSGFAHDKIVKTIDEWKINKNLSSKDIVMVYNKDYERYNVARSIMLGLENCQHDNTLIVYGDLIFNKETISNVEYSKSGMLLANDKQFEKFEVGVSAQNNKIHNFAYSIKTKWSQICYLNKEHSNLFASIAKTDKCKKYFSFEIFNIMLDKYEAEFIPYTNNQMDILEVDNSQDIYKGIALSKKYPCNH